MSDQNQNLPTESTTNNNTPTTSFGGMRFGRPPATNATQPQPNNTQNTQQNGQNTTPTTPFGRPFTSSSTTNRFGSSNTNANNTNPTNNNNNNQPAPSPSPFRSLSSPREQVESSLLPLHTVAVRFELKGLGDPFYRLLGHEVNTEYSDSRLVVRKLEQGGDDVTALKNLLDVAWGKYAFKGAAMVYLLENENLVKQLGAPSFMPKKDLFDDDDSEKKDEPPKPAIKVVRAIDMMLVLNVLARARTQVLLATSPIMFNQHYLNRALVTDDPRLVALAMATGVIS
ncbi:MAG: hypothetical protein CUN52_09710 [Phototrophicales bacterium]|nr:MAG: hypothetical protein CUN52_09710 [Phototrophicales bacterium]